MSILRRRCCCDPCPNCGGQNIVVTFNNTPDGTLVFNLGPTMGYTGNVNPNGTKCTLQNSSSAIGVTYFVTFYRINAGTTAERFDITIFTNSGSTTWFYGRSTATTVAGIGSGVTRVSGTQPAITCSVACI